MVSSLRQGAGTDFRLVFVATEACGGGTPNLGLFVGVYIFIIIFGVGISQGCPRGAYKTEECALGGGHALHLVDDSGLFWPNSFTSGASSGP